MATNTLYNLIEIIEPEFDYEAIIRYRLKNIKRFPSLGKNLIIFFLIQ